MADSTQLFPEVIDASELGPVYSQDQYFAIGIEGEMDNAGTATVGTPYSVTRPATADTLFGSSSSLAALVRFVLGRGIGAVVAVASAKGQTPQLSERQAAWGALEDDESIRLRLTDSTTQADLAALADSCEYADAVQNKQIAFVGMSTGTDKAALLAAADAIVSKRAVLVGPGIYDASGNLLSGSFAAAAIAAEVAKNSDLTDDLDTVVLSGFTGLEKNASGMPLFRKKAAGGVPVNDFEDLLQAGVSPLKQARRGGVEITHLRMTYHADATFDALMTRLIADQLFVDVRDYCEQSNFLRRGNTLKTRQDLAAGVNGVLVERNNWIAPKLQPNGEYGYGVAVESSSDNKQVTVSYSGMVVRGIQTIQVDAQLEIPA